MNQMKTSVGKWRNMFSNENIRGNKCQEGHVQQRNIHRCMHAYVRQGVPSLRFSVHRTCYEHTLKESIGQRSTNR